MGVLTLATRFWVDNPRTRAGARAERRRLRAPAAFAIV